MKRLLLFFLLSAACRRHQSPPPSPSASRADVAARTDPKCTAIAPFYWEIGDVSGKRESGSVGAEYDANSKMTIASASKWIFGAYVVERAKGDLAAVDTNAMTMRSGYVGNNLCVVRSNVKRCFEADKNDVRDDAQVGRFHYAGAHFQKYAVDLGLGALDESGLAAEMKAKLGAELPIEYATPLLAGGAETTPTGYALFLRKILAGKLAIHDALGKNATCTLPGTCPTALSSPAPEAWQYSYGHWVEIDGTFSSPGLFGFYPWIDAKKSTYGIVARKSRADKAYWASVECGRAIRNAYLSAP